MSVEITSKMIIPTVDMKVATLKDALVIFYGDQSAMAKEIGINRGTLRTKLNSGRDYFVGITTVGGETKVTYLNKQLFMCAKTKGRKQDKRAAPKLKQRQKSRRVNEDADNFAKWVMGMIG